MGVMSKREAAEILGIRQDASLRAAKVAYRLVLLRLSLESLACVSNERAMFRLRFKGCLGWWVSFSVWYPKSQIPNSKFQIPNPKSLGVEKNPETPHLEISTNPAPSNLNQETVDQVTPHKNPGKG